MDRLAGAFDRLADRLDTLESNGGGTGPVTDADKVTRHVRRYMPFYALAVVFAVFMMYLPSRPSGDTNTVAGELTDGTTDGTGTGIGTDTSTGTGTGTGTGTTTGTGNGTGTGTGAGTGTGTRTGPNTSGPTAVPAFDTLAWNKTGKTIANFDCKNGVRQIPWSAYAAPCYPKWTGGNPGATARGVTAKEITIVIRRFPESANSRAVEQATVAAGFASTEVARAVNAEFRKYFNKVFEMWGRKVKWVIYESKFGNSTDEAQSKGKEGACADANYIANELKAFGVLGETGGSNVFGECAAARGLMVFWSAPYFPQRWYQKHHPYVWHTAMDCERISYQQSEYIGKRLGKKPARWAKQLEKDKPRKYATYVPNNDEYQYCTDLSERLLKERYNITPASRYNYTLDISRFPDEAAKAAVQFKAAGATTLVMACDPISMVFLTQSARAQNWFPEWFNIGVALNDTDNFPRTWDPIEIRGSLFGMSQLGSTDKILGPSGEAPKTYKAATGTTIPEGTTGGYNNLMLAFNALQAAGPNLTPAAVGAAMYRLPPAGAPRYELGYISFQDAPNGAKGGTDHTGIDDSREIYWDADATAFDGKKGAYKETYGGKRFRNGQWPTGDPPIYP